MKRRFTWLSVLLLSGCTLYSSERQVQYVDAEGRVPAALFTRLDRQAASKPWLIKQLGQPMHITQVGHGGQVYTWALTRKDIAERSVLFIYRSERTKTQQSYLHLVFSGDTLLKHCLDRDAAVDTSALLNSRDLRQIKVAQMEQSALAPPVVTKLSAPTVSADE
jgi:hypothetical protein